MSIFLNPDNETFITHIKAETYVDKSEIVLELNRLFNTDKRYVCVSRARRFGKTMMTALLTAYFSKACNSRQIFQNLNLGRHDDWDRNLNSQNVIKIDLNGWFQASEDVNLTIAKLKEALLAELCLAFPQADITPDTPLANALLIINDQLAETFVIIIDEYDVLFRENVPETVRNEYLKLLSSLFKNEPLKKAIKLAYITGILPIIRQNTQSKLNNFREYTMLNPYNLAPYFGFTSDEVQALCSKFCMDYNLCQAMYDGYHFPNAGHIFNPNSVVECIDTRAYNSFWTPTSSYYAITDCINDDIDGIQQDINRMLEGEDVDIEVESYQNNIEVFASKDEVFTYLVHLGYLAYDADTRSCRIPNLEIRQEWIRVMENAQGFQSVKEVIATSRNLVQATLTSNAQAVAEALDLAHRRVSSNLTFNREATLQSAILMAYFYATKDFLIFPELPAGDGFADVAFIPKSRRHPSIIIELKKDADPQQAIDQIKERNYHKSLTYNPNSQVLLVGITYNSVTKRHACKIESIDAK
ncbi:MAG: ATP-binding protein [Bacteroidales bacterium]|nr:ATP-binding protein [Bacteroidales bacterium]